MLLNIVKVRYVEPPIFLDIAEVVAQYTFEGTASLNAPDWVGDPTGSVASIGGRWAESPTVTYDPMSGERFTKNLLRPIRPVCGSSAQHRRTRLRDGPPPPARTVAPDANFEQQNRSRPLREELQAEEAVV